MNVLYLDTDHHMCARYHSDVHVVSQAKEAAQILSAACSINGIWHDQLYRVSHKSHPCCQWAARSIGNAEWLLHLAFELSREYSTRRQARGRPGADHRSLDIAVRAWETISRRKNRGVFPDRGFTPVAQVMPEQYRGTDPVRAYRAYYQGEKHHLMNSQGVEVPAAWTVHGPPPWWAPEEQSLDFIEDLF